MTIVHCPRCRDQVTVPARASTKALVRCPLCLEEYLLREALAEVPPALIVIDGSTGGEEPELVGAGVSTGLAEAEAGDEYRLSGGGFEAALDSRPAAGASVAPARPGVKGVRPKRKERSALGEIAKVVLGGAIGCVLALLVLWWGFSRDDFRLGPRIAPYAPWIVPAKFRGKPADANGERVNASAANPASGNSSPKPSSANTGVGSDGVVADVPTDVPIPSPSVTDGPLTIDDPLAVKPASKAGTFASGLDDPRPAPDTNPAPFVPEAKPTKLKPPSETTETPLPTAADFEKAVLAATEGFAKLNDPAERSREERQQLYTEMYLAAAEVGRITTYLSTSDADLIDHVSTLKTFLIALAMQQGKVNALKSLTDLKLPERKHDEGVLLAAVVQDFQAAGSMFECTVQAGRKLTETPVICANNPQDFCQPGDELLVIGRVVENPRKNIPGYEGEHKRVVLYGYSVTVPKAEAPPPP